MKTLDSLGIFWSVKDAITGEVYQDEVSGLVFYGYWSSGFTEELAKVLPSFEAIWNGGAEFKSRLWKGETLSDLSIELRIRSWPAESVWPLLIQASLEWFVSRGATIAWCGTEYSSPSIKVFCVDDDQWDGSVYAVYSDKTGLLLGSDLSAEYRELESFELEMAYKIAFGIS
ncbi:hypothetical protein T3A99_17120 [Pseudomonas sp. N-137]|uniref:hypothetical protein n=1 Tax=Pseudomonas sp. N-137 TaxID=3108452 RepID=UPI002ADEAE57|nr:hypothetical protein [Pseudomonas sp. N-137]MEA1030290.1 hypothetical protein [Pseudomonas sp. N-137]